MRNVSATSREAFAKLKPRLGEMQRIVLKVIEAAQPVNNEQIAYILDWPINRITGRCTELYQMKFIQIEKVANNARGRRVKYWSVRDFNDEKLKEVL